MQNMDQKMADEISTVREEMTELKGSVKGVWTGIISTAVKTANERKAQLQAQIELERHNKELEKQISGNGVIVDFAEKLEGLPDKARLLVGDMLSSIAKQV